MTSKSRKHSSKSKMSGKRAPKDLAPRKKTVDVKGGSLLSGIGDVFKKVAST